ncbi:MAG: peptidylprolyl isomerase [Nitrospirae bacterium]|nr:peptidylprolyl isomerase [Nitrospirota bacterium]
MKLLRVFIFIIFVFMSHAGSQAGILLDRVVAVVNQDVITWSDLYKAMEFEASDKMRDLKDEEKRKLFKENEVVFLENLIDMKLQLQAAKQSGIEATPEDVNEAIADIKKKYSVDEKALIESLKKEGFSFEEYRKKLAEQIVLSRVVSQHVKGKIVVSPNEIEKYLKENKDALGDSTAYRIRQIFFKKPGSSSDRKALEERADEIFRKLEAGEDFTSLAQKYSEDPSGKSGGDLGFVKSRYLAKEFLDVISNMKTGDISRPFWTDKGLHIVKLEEKSEAGNEAEIKEAVRNKLVEKQFSEKYKGWVKELRENAYIEIRL